MSQFAWMLSCANACRIFRAGKSIRRFAMDFFPSMGDVARKGDRLSAGDRLVFSGPAALLAANPLPDTSLDVPIVYEDSSIFIVDKPAGIATHGFSGRDTGTLANYIAAQHPHLLGVGKNRWEPGLVHRLDTETSGLVLVAKTQTAFDRLRQQFRRRQVAKIYWALVWGTTNAAGVIDLPLAHDPRDKSRMRAVSESLRMKKIKTWKALTRYRKVGAVRRIDSTRNHDGDRRDTSDPRPFGRDWPSDRCRCAVRRRSDG